MNNFKDNVRFDPGYYKISFSFVGQISYLTGNYNQIKNPNQKKFQLSRLESGILNIINKSTAFYLGCMLWGGFLHEYFRDEPKEILGNNTKGMSEKELQDLDCSIEAKVILQYIENFDKDCKYFLKRPAKVSSFLTEVLNSYIEFAQLNDNFINVNYTNEIKLPKAMEHFKDLSHEQLDTLYEKINIAIDSNKIETLLDLGFYKA